MEKNTLKLSDKEYWHRFLPVYEAKLNNHKECNKILEFGVFKGDSIRWLSSRYPKAKIYGSDILDVQSEWPKGDHIKYIHVDQGNLDSIKNVFKEINGKLDLIIEDGSHFPKHQKNCLVESLKHMSSGGLYILEDIHTCHPEHSYYKSKNNFFSFLKKKQPNYISSLHLLLCLEHLICNKMEMKEGLLNEISKNSLFSSDEILYVFEKIETIEFYRRSTLPHKCFSCNSSEFDYHNLTCKCGVNIYSNSDSMTALITIK